MRLVPIVAMLALAACSGSSYGGTDPTPGPGGPPPAAATVQATAAAVFTPANATVRVGGTVTWAFGTLGHNVTFEDVPGAPADIGGANTSTNIPRTFPTAGTYDYECTLHPGMQGSVTVAATTTGGGGGGGGGGGYDER
jgi:plastocyanin